MLIAWEKNIQVLLKQFGTLQINNMTEKTYKLTYSRTRGTEKLSNKVILLKDTKPPKVGVICKTMGFNSITEILIDVIELKKNGVIMILIPN